MSDTRNRQRLSLNRDVRQGPVVEERLHKARAMRSTNRFVSSAALSGRTF